MKPLQFLSLTTLLALSPALGACDSGSPLPALVELTPELESGALVVSEVRADEARRVIGSGDFDGDGRDDLLVSPAAILWGPLTEGAETTLDANRELPPGSTTVADVDLDGVVEIITSGVVWSVSPQRDVRAFGIHDVGSHGRPAQVFVHDVLAGQLDRTSAEARAVEEICDRQVVVLGELPSHGESRGFQAKARIVELLVAECGFDVLLFEGPFYEFLGFQEAVNDGRAAPMQLDRAIGGIWLTRELAGWRRWLFDQTIGGALVVGGLDDQPSATSEYARATLPGLVASALTGVERRTCEASVARYLSWRYDDEHPLDETEQRHLTRCARLAAAELRPRNGAQGADLSHMMAENLASYFARQQGATGARERDEAMFRNFEWHRRRLPKDTRFIIWTATVHAARRQGTLRHKPLGTWLAEQWGARLAVLGFSALEGQSSMAGMPSKPLPIAPPGSLEARATAADTAWVYLGPAALRDLGEVPSRLLGRFTSADWSTMFDGVLVVQTEAAPVFEPRG